MKTWPWVVVVALWVLVGWFLWVTGGSHLDEMQRGAQRYESEREARNAAYRAQACLRAHAFFGLTSKCPGRATIRVDAPARALFDGVDAPAWCSSDLAPALRLELSQAARISTVDFTYYVDSKRPTGRPARTELAWEGGSAIVDSPALKPGASTVRGELPSPVSTWVEIRPKEFHAGVGKPTVCISELALFGTMPTGPAGVLGLAGTAAP